MPDTVSLALAIAAGLMLAEGLRSLVIAGIHKYTDWKTRRLLVKVQREKWG